MREACLEESILDGNKSAILFGNEQNFGILYILCYEALNFKAPVTIASEVLNGLS